MDRLSRALSNFRSGIPQSSTSTPPLYPSSDLQRCPCTCHFSSNPSYSAYSPRQDQQCIPTTSISTQAIHAHGNIGRNSRLSMSAANHFCKLQAAQTNRKTWARAVQSLISNENHSSPRSMETPSYLSCLNKTIPVGNMQHIAIRVQALDPFQALPVH